MADRSDPRRSWRTATALVTVGWMCLWLAGAGCSNRDERASSVREDRTPRAPVEPGRDQGARALSAQPASDVAKLAPDAVDALACGHTRTLTEGMIWQTVPASKAAAPANVEDSGIAGDTRSAGYAGYDQCLRLLRIDPRHHRLRTLTGFEHGTARSGPQWAADFQQSAVINASMFRPSGRSTGMLISGETVNNGKDTRKFGAFLAFDPVAEKAGALPPVAMFGRGCPGFDLDEIRSNYRGVVQNYRMLDCDGAAIAWKDEKRYSAAAVAVDADGWLVFIHVRTPYLMRDLTLMLAEPALKLKAAMYVEGGPEATLYVAAGGFEATLVGSYETGFSENDDNHRAWLLPNVIAVSPRAIP